MRILVYEFATGGEFADPSQDMLAEGYAMLASLISEMTELGEHTILTCFDEKFKRVLPCLYEKNFSEALDRCDAVFIIAPENDDVLLNLTQEAEKRGKTILGSNSDAVKIASDKWETYGLLKKLGIRTPLTIPYGKGMSDFPYIVKPKKGCGGKDVFLVRNRKEEKAVEDKIKNREKEFLCQEYVEGIQASVSLISNGRAAFPLSLNRQIVSLSLTTSYEGGIVPFKHELQEKAFSVSSQISSEIGCEGYVGVDVILSDDVYIIEVNPRLTTSYVGLCRVSRKKTAGMIIDAITKKKIPGGLEFDGSAHFSKSEILGGERIAPPLEGMRAMFVEVKR